MEILKLANLVLRFLLELGALGAVSYWGFMSGRGALSKFGLGIGAPLLITVVWGAFGSPAAPMQLSGLLHLLLELIIFGLATVALYAAGHPTLALIFAVIVVFNRALMHVWGQ